jgi:ribosomal-protein-alanine N-acetyltransferase
MHSPGLNDDPAVMEFLPRRLARNESDAYAARIRTDMETRGWGFWAVEVRRNWLAPREGTLGIRLGNRGGCREAAVGSLRFAFEKLTLQQIVAFTVPLNKRSIRVMERIGMSRRPCGRLRAPETSRRPPALRPHVLYRLNRSDWLKREE